MRFNGFTRTAIAFAVLAVCAAGAQAQQYQTAPVTVDRTGHLTTVGGTVIPYKEVTLTAQIPGQVEKVAGREGGHGYFQDAGHFGRRHNAHDDDILRGPNRYRPGHQCHLVSSPRRFPGDCVTHLAGRRVRYEPHRVEEFTRRAG